MGASTWSGPTLHSRYNAPLSTISRVYEQNGDASLSDGIQVLAEMGKMTCIDIGDCFWQDVDTPEMLEYAEKLLKNLSSKTAKKPS